MGLILCPALGIPLHGMKLGEVLGTDNFMMNNIICPDGTPLKDAIVVSFLNFSAFTVVFMGLPMLFY